MVETERLILREYTLQDFDAIYEILSDPETMQHYPKPFNEERTMKWIKWNIQNYKEYGFGLIGEEVSEVKQQEQSEIGHFKIQNTTACILI